MSAAKKKAKQRDPEKCAGFDGPFCKTMQERWVVQERKQNKIGLIYQRATAVDIAPNQLWRTLGILHRKDRQDLGEFLVYCPWCGAEIRSPYRVLA